jgi:hypothetical protein
MAEDFEPRPISAEEVAVIRAAFAQGQVLREVSPAALDALPSLTVVSCCPCGCASVTFARPDLPREAIVVDAVARHPDGSMLGLMVWGQPERITRLELYDYDGSGGYKRLPDPASVRSFYPT